MRDIDKYAKLLIERVTKIVAIARDSKARGEQIDSQQLADYFKVSIATITNDLRFMRDTLKIPIQWDRANQRYTLDANYEVAWWWKNESRKTDSPQRRGGAEKEAE